MQCFVFVALVLVVVAFIVWRAGKGATHTVGAAPGTGAPPSRSTRSSTGPGIERHQWEPSPSWQDAHYIKTARVTTKARGVTHDGRQAVMETLSPGDRLDVLSSDDPAHPAGVRLQTPDGRDAGWLPAERARDLRPYLDGTGEWSKPQVMDAWILDVTGGTSAKPNRGLNLWVAMRRNQGKIDGPWQHDRCTADAAQPILRSAEATAGPADHRREAAARQVGVGDMLGLLREPDNVVHSNAIVTLTPSGEAMGYLDGYSADLIAPLLDKGMRVWCLVSEIQAAANHVTVGVLVIASCAKQTARLEASVTALQRHVLQTGKWPNVAVELVTGTDEFVLTVGQ